MLYDVELETLATSLENKGEMEAARVLRGVAAVRRQDKWLPIQMRMALLAEQIEGVAYDTTPDQPVQKETYAAGYSRSLLG